MKIQARCVGSSEALGSFQQKEEKLPLTLETPQDIPGTSHTRGMCWAHWRTQIRHCPTVPAHPKHCPQHLGTIPTLGSREQGCGEEMGLTPATKLSTPVEPAPLSPEHPSAKQAGQGAAQRMLPTPSFPYCPPSRSGMSQILKSKSRAAQQLSQL